VPVAAGMGGGSSDAAAALRLAAHAAGRPDDGAATELAPGLGADVPVLLRPAPALMTGAGEVVEPVADPGPMGVVLIPDPEPLATPDVYAEADRLGLCRSAADLSEREAALRAALAGGGLPPAELLVNDLQDAARSLRPRIDEALAAAAEAGAPVAMVSGSGPTVFALFPGIEGPAVAAAAAESLARRFPGASSAVPADPSFAEVREA